MTCLFCCILRVCRYSMSQSDIITLFIAIYGALLSTIIAIREATKDKRRVKVVCRYAFAFPPGTNKTWKFISINVVNAGHRPIQINQAGILLSDGNSVTQLESRVGKIPLPKKLEDGESFEIMFDADKVEQAIKNQENKNVKFTKAFVSDAEGNRYTTRLPGFLKDKKLAK